MKVITLWQPWAQFVAMGWKTIETRTHDRFKGLVGQEILIHAGLKWDPSAIREAMPYLHSSWITFMQGNGPFFEAGRVGGNIIARASVVASRKLTPEDASQALIECDTPRYGLILAYIKPVHFVKASGKQGIWTYDGPVKNAPGGSESILST